MELQALLDEAYAKQDTEKVEALRRTIDRETLECTAHTAERLKRVEKNVEEIKNGLIPHKMFDDIESGLEVVTQAVTELKQELEAWKHRAFGAKLVWQILGYLAAAGGGGFILKLLTSGVPHSQ